MTGGQTETRADRGDNSCWADTRTADRLGIVWAICNCQNYKTTHEICILLSCLLSLTPSLSLSGILLQLLLLLLLLLACSEIHQVTVVFVCCCFSSLLLLLLLHPASLYAINCRCNCNCRYVALFASPAPSPATQLSALCSGAVNTWTRASDSRKAKSAPKIMQQILKFGAREALATSSSNNSSNNKHSASLFLCNYRMGWAKKNQASTQSFSVARPPNTL